MDVKFGEPVLFKEIVRDQGYRPSTFAGFKPKSTVSCF